MLRAKGFLVFLVFLLLFSWFSSSALGKRTKTNASLYIEKEYAIKSATAEKLKSRSNEAVSFARKNGYNTSLCFLFDMSLSSGQSRFFVYNMEKDSIEKAGLVTHGRCNQQWLEGRKYSNQPGCGCSSLGKYKVGYSYTGSFGLAYKLHGLDKSNSNAFKRFVVLHSHECVPERQVNGDICQSDGCPTVSPGFLYQLKPVIRKSSKPILLWIYE